MEFMKIVKNSMLVGMMVLLATGCGKTVSSVEENTMGTEVGTTTAEGIKQKLTVSVWDNGTSPQFSMLADAFMEKNPDVMVELIDTQADEYNNKLTVMLAGGDSNPDVILVKDAESQVTMKNKGQILNLDEYIKKDNIDLSKYNGVADELQIEGSNYTLPFRKDWYVLYYNKDLFDAANVEYPTDDMTWTEYEALAKKMTSGEGNSKVYGSHNHTWMALISNWAVQDGKDTLMSEDYSFLKPYYQQALRMQEEGIIQSYANLKTGSIHYVSVFEQQQCAMLPMGSWFITTLIKDKAENAFDFNWGVTRIPHPEGVKPGTTVGSTTPIAINAKSKSPDLAWEFIKYATSEEGGALLASAGVFPAIESEAVTAKLSSIEGFPEDGKIALATTGFVFDRPLDEKMASVRRAIEVEHDLIMIGEEEIDTGIANMNAGAKEAKEE